VPQDATDQILGQLTDATIRLFGTNLDLMTRFSGGARTGADPEPSGFPTSEGPAQDLWMTWAESVGDLVQITYLTAQLVDSMWGRDRTTSDPT
jgi:hypothetical protein